MARRKYRNYPCRPPDPEPILEMLERWRLEWEAVRLRAKQPTTKVAQYEQEQQTSVTVEDLLEGL